MNYLLIALISIQLNIAQPVQSEIDIIWGHYTEHYYDPQIGGDKGKALMELTFDGKYTVVVIDVNNDHIRPRASDAVYRYSEDGIQWWYNLMGSGNDGQKWVFLN